ncbi:MAG: PepSY domain-containing protein [Rhodobacteraceae bacterium]|nr:PepSY domain-containing protein [Paracoccaceae bacterium]
MRALVTMAALAAILAAGTARAAVADGGGGGGDDDGCTLPMAQWQAREAVTLMAEARDWTLERIGTDDGCYEITGRDADGWQFEADIHPGTLEVIEIDYKDDDDRVRGNDRGR